MTDIIEYLRSDETKREIISLIKKNLHLYENIDTDQKIQNYSGLIYNNFVSECVQKNQFISLSNETINKINIIYYDLTRNLTQLGLVNQSDVQIALLVNKHRERLLSALLENSNYKTEDNLYIPCSEYSGLFQYRLLRLDEVNFREPIIDIGCGKNAELITYLKSKGYNNILGIDQYQSQNKEILCSNWLDYSFTPDSWNTVISHMAFSNHFRRSSILKDKMLADYKTKYYEILNAINISGLFIYTPSVRNIEDELDKKKYSIKYFKNTRDNNLDTVVIQRLP